MMRTEFRPVPPYVKNRLSRPLDIATMLLSAENYFSLLPYPYTATVPQYLYEFLDNRHQAMPATYWMQSLYDAGIRTAEQLLDLAIARKRITPMMHSDVLAEIQQIRMSTL